MQAAELTHFFAARTSNEPDHNVGRIEFSIVNHLLQERQFDSVDGLIRYCRRPANLGFCPTRAIGPSSPIGW